MRKNISNLSKKKTDLASTKSHGEGAGQFISTKSVSWRYQFVQIEEQVTKNPPVLLIHGTGGTLETWNALVDEFTKRKKGKLLIFDLPGHGGSKCKESEGVSTLSEIAREISELLILLQIREVDMAVGHSAGTAIAMEINLQKLIIVNKIIGINPSLVPPPVHFNLALFPFFSPILTSKTAISLITTAMQKTSLVDLLIDSTGSELSSKQKQSYKNIFKNESHILGAIKFMADTDLKSLLKKSKDISCPLTLIAGEKDKWVNIESLKKTLKEFLPKSYLIKLSGGHLLNETHPKAIAEIIFEHLRLK